LYFAVNQICNLIRKNQPSSNVLNQTQTPDFSKPIHFIENYKKITKQIDSSSQFTCCTWSFNGTQWHISETKIIQTEIKIERVE